MPNSDPPAAAWSSSETDRFDWRCWNGGAVVYVLATGSTHELGATASDVLSVLLKHPGVACTEAQLLAALGDEESDEAAVSPADAERELQTLRELLGYMAGMGLVSRHSLQP